MLFSLTVEALWGMQQLPQVNTSLHHKNWDTYTYYHNYPENGTIWFHSVVMDPKDPDTMVNSIDPDQTAPWEQSDLGLHCLLRSRRPNT